MLIDSELLKNYLKEYLAGAEDQFNENIEIDSAVLTTLKTVFSCINNNIDEGFFDPLA